MMLSLLLLPPPSSSPPPSPPAVATAISSSSSLAVEMIRRVWRRRRTTTTTVSTGRRNTSSSVLSLRRGNRRPRGTKEGGTTATSVVSVPGAYASSDEGVRVKRGDEEPGPGNRPLPPSLRLQRDSMPRHVAVIMDGNSRWARARGLPASAGHEAGYRALRVILDLSASWGIRALTVFALSSENWLRPKAEVDFLMRLFEGVLQDNLQDFLRQGIRLCWIGDSSKLPKLLQQLVKEAEEVTRHNTRLELIVAISYSGRGDIVQACQKIAVKVRDGILEPADITESMVAEELETNCTGNFPYPDLLIRTSGELRLSNFLLWQSAYTELFFADSLWPDFGEADYVEALLSFQQRQRRFGKRSFRT